MRNTFYRTVLTGIITLLFCCSCRTVPFQYQDMEPLDSSLALTPVDLPPWQKIALQARMVLETPFHSTSVICMMQSDSDRMTLAAMLPAGVKFMEISGSSDKVEKWYFMPGFIRDKAKQQEMAGALLQDFSRIFMGERFLYPGELPGAEMKRRTKGIELVFPDKGETRFYGSKRLRLMKKTVKNKDSDWQTEYFRCSVRNDFIYPDKIVYENARGGYRLILRVYEFEAE